MSPDTTSTVTTPQAPAGTNITAPVAVDTSVFDKAVVTGTTAGGTPTGTVDFFICSPLQVQGTAGSETCAIGGTALSGNPRTLVGGRRLEPAVGFGDVEPRCRREHGRHLVLPRRVHAERDQRGQLHGIQRRKPQRVLHRHRTRPRPRRHRTWLPNDSATVTSAGGTHSNGTLSFTLYSGDNCGATSGSILIPAESFTLTDERSPATRSDDELTFKVSATATTSWKVVFTSSDPLVGGFTKCTETTALTIAN